MASHHPACADLLDPIFTQIFNRSLELCKIPSCFPKESNIKGLNDNRSVALTSVVMKTLERPLYLKDIIGDLLDPLLFACQASSVDDAVNMELHCALQHLDPWTYATAASSHSNWITSILKDRKRQGWGNSLPVHSTLVPLRDACALSPLLFSLYNSNWTSQNPSSTLYV